MKNNKRFLIISMTCGEGHNSVAKALKEKLDLEGQETKIIQLFYHSERRVKFENWQYLFACKYLRRPYSFFWNRSNNLNPEKRDSLFVHKVVKKTLKPLSTEIADFSPDCIISTHPYSSVAVNDMIKFNMFDWKKIKTISILTDYCVHPYWEAGLLLDYIITPSENTTKELFKRGYKQKQIKVLGYPVANKFSNIIDKQEARRDLNIPDKFTVMVMSGGNGIGKTFNFIKEILKTKRDFQLLCICGRNKKSKKQLDRYIEINKIENVITFGFVANIEVLMSASEVIFSRGGGVSTTEAINLNVPIIIREKMIINEKLNKDFFLKNKVALSIENINETSKIIEKVYDNPEMLKEIKENQLNFAKPDATTNIANFALSILN